MPRINLTAAAFAALRKLAQHDFADTSAARPNGTFDVPLEGATLARLDDHRMAGESYSDAILRLTSTSQ